MFEQFSKKGFGRRSERTGLLRSLNPVEKGGFDRSESTLLGGRFSLRSRDSHKERVRLKSDRPMTEALRHHERGTATGKRVKQRSMDQGLALLSNEFRRETRDEVEPAMDRMPVRSRVRWQSLTRYLGKRWSFSEIGKAHLSGAGRG